jgi:hypothetical protein
MSKNIQKITSVFLTLIVIVIGNYVIVAQSSVSGTWKAEVKSDKSNEIYVSFERKTTRGKNQHGTDYKFSDLQGLSYSQMQNGKVRFTLVREAGNIEATGEFSNGKGRGNFTFTPNRNFVDAMKTRGFDFEKPSKYDREDEPENRLFAAATLNVTTAIADDLLSANFGKLEIEDLFKAAIFKIDGKFMAEMKASGFPDLEMEDLVKARIFKIDADFVRQVVGMGFKADDFEDLVKMSIFKITPEFITETRNEGFANLDIEDLVKMKIFNIDAKFIREAKSEGVPLEVEKLVQKRIGVWRK